MTGPRLVGALVGAAVLPAAAPARGRVIDDRLEVYGYAQLWATLWEEMADARGLYQHPSGDEATASLSGFSLARARVGVRWQDPASDLSVHAQVKLDHAVELPAAGRCTTWTGAPRGRTCRSACPAPGVEPAITGRRPPRRP